MFIVKLRNTLKDHYCRISLHILNVVFLTNNTYSLSHFKVEREIGGG